VFTARYALSPSKKEILSICKELIYEDFCHWLYSPYLCCFISQRDIIIVSASLYIYGGKDICMGF
jgi:hypothetical protein